MLRLLHSIDQRLRPPPDGHFDPRRALRRTTLGILCGAALCGCSTPGSSCVSPADAGIALAVGTIEPGDPQSFHPLTDGDGVFLVPGLQGGQHIWIRVRGEPMCPSQPRLRIRVIRASDDVVIGFSQFAGNTWTSAPGSSGTYASPAYAAIIDADKYCPLVNGGAIRVQVLLDDTDGRSATTSVNVVITGWSPDASPAMRAAREACCADPTNTTCWPAGVPDAGD